MSPSRGIVITGSSSGIGAALAELLCARGDRVILAARRETELEAVVRRCHGRGTAVVTDVRRRVDVVRLCDRAIETLGAIDVWVNNAGRGISKTVLELTDEEFDEMMAVNVKSALYGMQAVVPQFIRRGQGHLINVSSFLGRVPIATHRSAYNAAKSALNALTANLRVDLGREHPGIHVTLVSPGLVTTEFGRNALHGSPPMPPGIGPARPQTAEEIAATIAGVIDAPVADVYTAPALQDVVKRYYDDVGAFEAGWRR